MSGHQQSGDPAKKMLKVVFPETSDPGTFVDGMDGLLLTIPSACRKFDKWASSARGDEIVYFLNWLSDQMGQSYMQPFARFNELKESLYSRIRRRSDYERIALWLEAGTPPPAFALGSNTSPCNRSPARQRISARSRRRQHRRTDSPVGFPNHVRMERIVLARIRNSAPPKQQGSSSRPDPHAVNFYETPGPRQLFSIPEAARLFEDADITYGRDNRPAVAEIFRKAVRLGNRRYLACAPSPSAIDRLRKQFPNASDLIDCLDRAASLSRLSPSGDFQIDPILIYGEPGVGKTAVLQAVAEAMGVPFRRFDMGALSMGNQLLGLSFGWSTGHAGDIFNMLIESPCMNPVALFDELDKASGNRNALVIPGLLAVLERETSRRFMDEAVKLPIDASQVCWFATANDLTEMSSPLRSRFVEVRIDRPEGEDAISVAKSIYTSIRRQAGWGHMFPEELDRSIACRLADCVPREMSRRLALAFGEAARQGRCYLVPDDLPRPVVQRRPPGFI